MLDTLGSEIDRLGAHRVLMLTARSLEDAPLMRRIIPHLGVRHAGTIAMEFEHVPLESVAAVVAAARRWSADTIVALGGGSVVDAAKAARICIAAGLISADDLGAFIEDPGPLINGLIPQLSIPTTLSGAEYTRSFSATNFTLGIKRSYTNSAAASRVIMYDPLATMDTPMRLWLASGVMAIDHAVEVFCASPPHPVGDTLKLAAVRELISNLPLTRQTPADANARVRCQIAAWMADHSPLRTHPLAPAAVALPSHALAYELGALCRVSYGIVACVSYCRPPCAGPRRATQRRPCDKPGWRGRWDLRRTIAPTRKRPAGSRTDSHGSSRRWICRRGLVIGRPARRFREDRPGLRRPWRVARRQRTRNRSGRDGFAGVRMVNLSRVDNLRAHG